MDEYIYIQYLCSFVLLFLSVLLYFGPGFESKTTIYVYLINILCLLEYVYIVIIMY